jgi:phenylalanyl-tRNA synthetase beta chain
MKFPYSMLLDFVETLLSADETGDLLTMAGFELEGIEEVEGEPVLDIKVMSNRGDGLSVFGLAREVLAKDPEALPTELYRAAASRFSNFKPQERIKLADDAATIEAVECNRFACRSYRNVPARAVAPNSIQQRLQLAGMRPISLLVDLTNYVMLELGQPLHAFDQDKLAEGRIVVRHACPGEKLTTLNGEEHGLDGQMMICDALKPVGVPGVMGGLETEVSDATKTVLLESANFLNTCVRKTRKQLGLNTEASYRFERSVDPDGVVAAIQRFTQLLLQASQGVEISNIVDHYPRPLQSEDIVLRPERARILLGLQVSPSECATHLRRLGMTVRETPDALVVTTPSWRPDITREEDLVEEIGRVHGYEKIPERLPEGTTTPGGPQGLELWTDMIREAAIRAGLVQTISHSLRDRHPLDDPKVEAIGPRNPASPDMALLRNSLLPSLSDVVRRNNSKGIRLFEIGKTFGRRPQGFLEELRLGVLDDGFFQAKGTVESILEAGGLTVRWIPPSNPDPRLHPTRQAAILAGEKAVGYLGQIHPDAAEDLGMPETTAVGELWLVPAYESRSIESALKAVSRYPAVRRDISIQISKEIPFARIEAALCDAAGPMLEEHALFDIYEGKGIPEGSHSLAISIQLRKLDGTFTDEEANLVRDRVLAALASLGAIRR